MVKLTPEMMEMVRSVRHFPLATASKDGEPNVVPVGSVFVMDPETIWIGNQFMRATAQNLQENSRACLYVWGPDTKGCLKLKGEVTVVDSGDDYERMKDMVKARRSDLVCKALLVFKVTAVHNCKSGADAGEKLV